MASTNFMVIDLSPEGEATALHRDVFPLDFLGKQKIERASEIIFNEDSQRWDIHLRDNNGGFAEVPQARGIITYDKARDVEVEWLEQAKLKSVEPRSYEGLSCLIAARLKMGV